MQTASYATAVHQFDSNAAGTAAAVRPSASVASGAVGVTDLPVILATGAEDAEVLIRTLTFLRFR